MKRRRATLAACVFLALSLFVAFVIRGSSPIQITVIGRKNLDDGSVGYFFSVTNRSNRPLEVRLYRNEAPPKVSGVATIVKRTMAAQSQWYVALCPPDEPVPWSASLEYFQEPSPLMMKLRPLTASLHFRVK